MLTSQSDFRLPQRKKFERGVSVPERRNVVVELFDIKTLEE
ncbi:hypothetical protein TUN199_11258 [Pyrenophora tritici-repentis]|uniref:Uncharacterized protein n=1 Tax=Pyrenophora tritici-repentis TaxID=45151 RepID=A0A5M9KUN5_9PLEO|nr:hypothetical protein PtrV1_12599 [Pyrenophora tritici-repentis]KAF7445412.1 hypothetical protein A1F99_103980 [Pyrenophora tritici-repentis]KAF7565675.1 hypothetical protein PtrM4_051090 [Pyrenophora tritici-repentis]KAI0569704.1 hypothetical protein Alg215_11480 [Pyrenophora tritici-repentis]KAI0570306.1 hypothetical protein Alg130_11277 [Pyrenophora tritici-repentis]